MRFAQPELLWCLLAVPLLVLAGAWTAARRRRALARFAGGSEHLRRFDSTISVHRRAAKMLLLHLALISSILALARPQWGTRVEAVTREGVDVVVVLDHSLSMAAEDMAPSRLELAKHEIDGLLEELGGHRLALVTFAGEATLACPLTLDQSAVRLFLDAVDVESIQVPGTALAEALRLAVATLGEPTPGQARGRALVLFTDGEDHEGGLEEVLRRVVDGDIQLFAVGTGTVRGAPIPLKDTAGLASGYKKDREGRVVTTRLNESGLERLALDTGGRYYRATASELEVTEIAEALSRLDASEFGAVMRTRYEERFQLPLTLALLALLLEMGLGDRRRVRVAPTDLEEAA